MAPPEDGGKVLAANGEIYNHAALRASHCAGYGFTSNSDCETVLALWARHGTAAFGELRGMYAAALWDPHSREGVLVRDPFGIKPLYIAETAEGILFASEIAALRAAIGGTGETDPVHAACIIDRQYAPDDLPPFAGIRRVAPGETLIIRDGRIAGTSSDRPLDDLDHAGDAAEFPARLHDSVEAHLMADVPLGLFFSGGVDSSAILAALADLRARDGHADPILSYTVRFDTEADDETALAASLAADEGAEFIDVPYGRDDFLADAGLAALACDDPVADYAILPTSHLARRARATSRSFCRQRAATNSSPDMAATAPGCALWRALSDAARRRHAGRAVLRRRGGRSRGTLPRRRHAHAGTCPPAVRP